MSDQARRSDLPANTVLAREKWAIRFLAAATARIDRGHSKLAGPDGYGKGAERMGRKG